MNIYSLLPLCWIMLFSGTCLAQDPLLPSKPNQEIIAIKIDSIAGAFLEQGNLTGVSIAVVFDEETLYHSTFGYADLEKTQPLSNKHYFLMASISKLVGATVVMKLVEEGKLSLDQSLEELVPDFPHPHQARKIKLRHLISHTSGLQDYAAVIDSIYIKTRQDPTKEDYYKFYKEHELLFEPGSNYAYSNSGFRLMAMIVERITGQTFQSEVDRIINRPSGIDLQLIAKRHSDPLMAPYYEFQKNKFQHIPHWTWIKGDGGLTATSRDLALFPFKWIDETIVSKKSLEEMCRSTPLGNGMTSGYGLGVRTGNLEGEPVIGHTGGNKSFKSVMQYFPQRKMSVVVMVNTDNTTSDALYIAGFVALAALEKPVPELQEAMEGLQTNYEGEYERFQYGSSRASHTIYQNDEGQLYRKSTGSESKGLHLYHLGGHVFAPQTFPMDRIIFETDTKGNVLGFREYYNGFFFRAPVKVRPKAMSTK